MAHVTRSNTANGGTSYFDLIISVTSISDASYTVRGELWLTSNNVVDGSNSLAVSGNWSRSGTLALNGAYSATPVWESFIVVSRAYGAATPLSVTAVWSGVEYWGTTLSATSDYSVPARPYSAPAAPTSVTATRVSNTQHTVAWTNNSTGGTGTSAPYLSQRVQRWDNAGGSWVTIADGVSGSASSYTDNTTVANRRYQYRVVAVNTTASTTSAASSAVQTTPAAPTSVSAAKSGTDIVVTFTEGQSSGMNVQFEVYDKPNGGARTLLATVSSGLGTYTHTSPNAAQTHQYEVRAKSTVGATLYSGYVASGVVQLLTAPNAPTGLSPNGVAADAGEGATLAWTHNPVDTTAQTKFQVRHRKSGGSWTTVTAVTSATSSWTLTGGTYASGDSVEWQVRTWGAATTGGSDGTGASPWSATATVAMSTRPTVTLSAPGATVTSATVTAEWAFFSAASATQAAWRATLSNGGGVIETISGAGATDSVTFTTLVADGASYTVAVEVQDSAGLWSLADTAPFDVEYLPPAAVTATVTFDEETGRAYIQTEADGTVEDVTDEVAAIDIQRRIGGGEWVTIFTGLEPNTLTYDPMAHIVGESEYRIIGYSAIGAAATNTPVTLTVDTQYSYVTFGPGMSGSARLLGGQQFGREAGRERALVQLAHTNRPTLLVGDALTDRLQVQGATVVGLTSSFDDFAEAAQAGTIVGWRDSTGLRIEHGSISPVTGVSSWVILGDVAFTIDEVAA